MMSKETTNGVPPHKGARGECRITVVTTRAELDAYSGEWNALLAAARADSVFLTWEWVSSWLDTVWSDHLTVKHPLLCIAIRAGNGQLVAMAPFYCTSMQFLGTLHYQCLRVIGDVNAGAEYPDLIIHRDYEEIAIPLIAATLNQCADKWDCLWVPNMSGWTGAEQRFGQLCSAGHFLQHQRPRAFSSFTLPKTHDEYEQMLPRKRRQGIRRATEKLTARHQIELVCVRDGGTLPQLLDALFELHHRHWSSVQQPGSFVRRPRMADFYRQFARVALKQGWLRLYGLAVDGSIRAVQYGYAYRSTLYAMQEGYDPEMEGIGNVLRNMVIKTSIEAGLREYDFLGGYTEHKRLWRAEERLGYDFFIGRRCIKNRPLFLKPVWPTGRYLRDDADRSASQENSDQERRPSPDGEPYAA